MLRSIRWKVALGLALPVLAALVGFSIADYYRRNILLTNMAENSAVQMGEMVRGGLRHAMLQNDKAMLMISLREIRKSRYEKTRSTSLRWPITSLMDHSAGPNLKRAC